MNRDATTVTIAVPSTKLGTDSPSRPTPWPTVSRTEFGREAPSSPSRIPARVPRNVDSSASSTVTGSAFAVIDATETRVLSAIPRLPVSTLPIHEKYCAMSDWSIP